MTDAEKAKTLSAARDAFAAAEQAYKKLIRETYPVGSYVRWRERPYIKAGNVTGYSLTGHSLHVRETGHSRHKPVNMEAVIMAGLEES